MARCPLGVCPSGQRERAVNPPAQPTEVRILPPPSGSLEQSAAVDVNEVEVRAADPRDAESVARIHIETWQFAYAHAFPQAGLDRLAAGLDGRIRFWQETIESKENARILVACREGRIL